MSEITLDEETDEKFKDVCDVLIDLMRAHGKRTLRIQVGGEIDGERVTVSADFKIELESDNAQRH